MSIATTSSAPLLAKQVDPPQSLELGFGVELEGLIVDKNGQLVQVINLAENREILRNEDGSLDQNYRLLSDHSIEYSGKEIGARSLTINQYVHQLIANEADIRNLVSDEQIAGHLEFKSNTNLESIDSSAKVSEVRDRVRTKLQEIGLDLKFTPVVEGEYEAIPADTTEDSRNMELFRKWEAAGVKPKLGLMSGLQVNISAGIFEHLSGSEDDLELAKAEISRQMMNAVTQDLIDEFGQNDPTQLGTANRTVDTPQAELINRRTQLDLLIGAANEKRFIEFGFTREEILMPPHFETIRDMLAWMVAFDDTTDKPGLTLSEFYEKSDLEILQGLRTKNLHPYTAKMKRIQNELTGQANYVMELRYMDSREFKNDEEMANYIQSNIDAVRTSMGLKPGQGKSLKLLVKKMLRENKGNLSEAQVALLECSKTKRIELHQQEVEYAREAKRKAKTTEIEKNQLYSRTPSPLSWKTQAAL